MEQMPGVPDTHHCVMEAAFSRGPVTESLTAPPYTNLPQSPMQVVTPVNVPRMLPPPEERGSGL